MKSKVAKVIPCKLCQEGVPHGGQIVPSCVFAPEMLVNVVASFCSPALEASIPAAVDELFRVNPWMAYLEKKYGYKQLLINHLWRARALFPWMV